jgi:multiple sugar transport system substrate-binding protein
MSDTIPPPPPPPVPVAPAPPIVPHKRSKLPLILFILIGLVVILILAFTSGLASKVVPGLGTTTLTYWGLWEPDSVIRPVLDEFEKTHSGIKVNYVMQSPQEYRERLQTALSQNKGPDIFRIHNTWTPMFASLLSPIPPAIIPPADYEKTFYPIAQKDLKLNGNYVAIPLGIDDVAMYINDDLLQKSGLPVPQNWVDLTNAALTMSRCTTPDGACTSGSRVLISGAALGATNVDHWQDILAAIMLQNNVNLANPASPNPIPAEDVIGFFTSFVKIHHIWDPILPSSTESFAAGKVGIYFAPSWRVFDIKAINPNLRFSIYPIPQLPVDPQRGEKPITYASYWAEAVSIKSKYQKEAWELLKYLSTSEVMQQSFQKAITSERPFGEPYSRVDLADSLKATQYINAFISQAPLAASWYLTSFTHDGPTGINSKISDIFARAVNDPGQIRSLSGDINAVLSEYGITGGP